MGKVPTPREIKAKKDKLEAKKAELESIQNDKIILEQRVKSYAEASGGNDGEPAEIYKVFIPGGSDLRLNYYQLNNLGKQMNVYFARLDNPFLDSYNADQREELVRSILGTPTGTAIPTTPSTVITTNDANDVN